MAILFESLLYFARDALMTYSENFRLVSRVNPVLVNLNGQRYSVHISSVHDSGNTRPNEDELRIQIGRNTIDIQRDRARDGAIPIFLGFYPSGEVFTAWDPEHVFAIQAQTVSSLYASRSNEEVAAVSGAGLRMAFSNVLQRETATISMQTIALGVYVENWSVLHQATDQRTLQNLLHSIAGEIATENKTGVIETQIEIGKTRRRIVITRESYARDPKFTESVLAAYDHTCCICGRQLKLVQAAHIIPHSDPDCEDIVRNGLALCVEHHKLYDDALLLPRAEGRLHLNPDRVEHLRNIGQQSGLESLSTLVANGYRVPAEAEHRPDNTFLERGFRIRLGEDN